MTDCCSTKCVGGESENPRYRRILWIALWVNAAMFGVEVAGGIAANMRIFGYATETTPWWRNVGCTWARTLGSPTDIARLEARNALSCR